jgi:hypothetical protein
MLFTLEAVFAKQGDALILHYGPAKDPKWLLIDGGPGGVYESFLAPRFQKLREDWEFESPKSFPLELVLVSHVDDDHINGILDLFEEQLDAHESRRPLPFKIKRLWHNSFDDIIGNQGDEIVSELSESLNEPGAITASPIPDAAAAVVASVGQGRRLRQAVEKLGMKKLNAPFEGLVMAPDVGLVGAELGDGLRFSVLGPSHERVVKFQERWDKDLKAILKKEKEAAEVASMTDGSPFNLASIVVLAQLGDRSMLLTGDARGDFIEEGLESAGLLEKDGPPFHVDLFKLPHHGSDRNVTREFFARVTADHYVISGDGHHGNPEPDTLRMLAAARGADPYTLHLTVCEHAHETETSEERRENLKKLADWLDNERPDNCQVVFRDAASDALSIHVDLGEPLD